MIRIIAGKYRGRKIDLPKDKKVRPTSDMVRGAAFNILTNLVDWETANVLDVCCGTGAFGIEAFSRGAGHVTFIDSSRDSIDLTKSNLEKLDESGKYELVHAAIESLPRARREYNVIYVDPPYFSGLVPKALKNLKAGGWIAADAIILAEVEEKEKSEVTEGFTLKDERRYGNKKLRIILPA